VTPRRQTEKGWSVHVRSLWALKVPVSALRGAVEGQMAIGDYLAGFVPQRACGCRRGKACWSLGVELEDSTPCRVVACSRAPGSTDVLVVFEVRN
jgi:hypothetical protein